MFWFISGLVVNIIAILLVIANQVYDSMKMTNTSHNDNINIIGVVILIFVIVAIVVKVNGHLIAANVILWIPAAPLFFIGIFFAGYLFIASRHKGSWN